MVFIFSNLFEKLFFFFIYLFVCFFVKLLQWVKIARKASVNELENCINHQCDMTMPRKPPPTSVVRCSVTSRCLIHWSCRATNCTSFVDTVSWITCKSAMHVLSAADGWRWGRRSRLTPQWNGMNVPTCRHTRNVCIFAGICQSWKCIVTTKRTVVARCWSAAICAIMLPRRARIIGAPMPVPVVPNSAHALTSRHIWRLLALLSRFHARTQSLAVHGPAHANRWHLTCQRYANTCLADTLRTCVEQSVLKRWNNFNHLHICIQFGCQWRGSAADEIIHVEKHCQYTKASCKNKDAGCFWIGPVCEYL